MSTPAEPRSETTDGPIRVFIVDDHGMVRRGMRSYLSIFGDIEVVGEAGDGREDPLVAVDADVFDALAPQPGRERAGTADLRQNHVRNSGQQLSGGEQQMLSIGRALMGNPSLLLLDEPMEGLAPVIIEQLTAALHRLRTESDISILLVEQHVDLALELSSRVIVLDRGRIVYNNGEGNSPPDRRRIEDLAGIGDHD